MQQEPVRTGCEEGFVDVAGARVHYLHAGTGKPMILIHGLVGSCANWRTNIGALAHQGSVYAVDLMNMGKSERVAGLDPGLKATASRIVALMDSLNLAEADIIGHSHGGAVALMLAALHPRRVRRLILFAPANPYCRSSDRLVRAYSTSWGGFVLRILPYLPALAQRMVLGEMYGGPDRVLDVCLREYVDGLRNPGTLRHVLSIIRCWFAEMAKLKRALPRVAKIPTLLLWGDRDCTVSLNSGIKLNRKLRASKLVVFPGRGHSVFEEVPEEANRMMLEWLDSCSASTALPPIGATTSNARRRSQSRSSGVAAKARATPTLRRLSPGT
jgi:4,5:9,10-diseco-3-hydroxy-5,9,17-trioxoandrosta-1(10),2-diene-4-oate hydrolase